MSSEEKNKFRPPGWFKHDVVLMFGVIFAALTAITILNNYNYERNAQVIEVVEIVDARVIEFAYTGPKYSKYRRLQFQACTVLLDDFTEQTVQIPINSHPVPGDEIRVEIFRYENKPGKLEYRFKEYTKRAKPQLKL